MEVTWTKIPWWNTFCAKFPRSFNFDRGTRNEKAGWCEACDGLSEDWDVKDMRRAGRILGPKNSCRVFWLGSNYNKILEYPVVLWVFVMLSHHSQPLCHTLAHGVSPAKQSLSSACWERSYMCVRLVSYDFLWVRTLIETSLLGDRPVGDLSRHARACDAIPRKRWNVSLLFQPLFSTC